MKAADIFSSLLAEPVAPEGAPTKDAPVAGAFEAVLAEAVDQDAAKQEGQTPAEAKGQVQQTEQTSVREQTIVVPSGPLSIHGSISRGLREKGVSSPRDALTSAAPTLTASEEGTNLPLRGEPVTLEASPVAEAEASDTDYEHQDDGAAMQNVLGHVAAAIARIVAPSQSAAAPSVSQASQQEASVAADAQLTEGGLADARPLSGANSGSRLRANEVVLEQPEGAPEQFVLPQEGAPQAAPLPGGANRSVAPHTGEAVEQAPSSARPLVRSELGTARRSTEDAASGRAPSADAEPDVQVARTAYRGAEGRAASSTAPTDESAAQGFGAQRDGARAVHTAHGSDSATRGQGVVKPNADNTQQAAMNARSAPVARLGARFEQQASFSAAPPEQSKGVSGRDELSAAAATDPTAVQLPSRAPALVDDARSEQQPTTRQGAAPGAVSAQPDGSDPSPNALLGAAFGTRGEAARAPLGPTSAAGASSNSASATSGPGVPMSSAAQQRAQLDRAGVRFEATNEPSVQVTFEGNADAAPTNAPAHRGYAAAASRTGGAAGSPTRGASTNNVSAPSPNAAAPNAVTNTQSEQGIQTRAALGAPATTQAVVARSSGGAVRASVDVQGVAAPQANAVATSQQASAQPGQQPQSNARAASAPASTAQSKQQPGAQASQPVQTKQATAANPSEQQSAGGTLASAASGETERTARPGSERGARPTVATGNVAGRRGELAAKERNADPAAMPELAPRAPSQPTAAQPTASAPAQPAPVQSANAANTNAPQDAQPRVTMQAAQPAAQPAPAAAVVATQQLEQAAVAVGATREDQASDKPRAAKGPADPMARVEGFSRGARFGAALSAYSGRGHDNAEHDTRGKRSEERERDVASDKSPAESFTQVIDQSAALQPAPTVREASAPEFVGRTPAVPVAVPVPEQTDIEFSRTPIAQPQNASISLHHPDLGPIQIQVQRLQDRVEVSAVIESAHAEAVLRANESGIRIGVQQSGMTFGALKVKLRGQDRERDKDNARPGQERRRRGIERGI